MVLRGSKWRKRRPSGLIQGGLLYLSEIYEKFSKKYPKVRYDYEQLGVSCRSAGPLEQKVQDPLRLGIANGAKPKRSYTVPYKKGTEDRCKPGGDFPYCNAVSHNHGLSQYGCRHSLGREGFGRGGTIKPIGKNQAARVDLPRSHREI